MTSPDNQFSGGTLQAFHSPSFIVYRNGLLLRCDSDLKLETLTDSSFLRSSIVLLCFKVIFVYPENFRGELASILTFLFGELRLSLDLMEQMLSFDLMEQMLGKNGLKKVQLLPARNDEHGGVIVELQEPMDSNVFYSMLRASLVQWRLQGKRGVWIKVPIGLANLIDTAVKEGFWFHHAEPSYLMLVYWIPKTPDTIPANATHRVGIGAIVMNEHRELLVVQENSGNFKGTGIWKIPTGVVEEGEDIFEGAIREVKEETGIDTEFVELLAFSQTHKSFFEKSDLFFVCVLRPFSFAIEKQDLEIEAAQWMPFEEYAAQPFIQKHSFFKYINDLWMAKEVGKYRGFVPVPITSFFNDPISYLYVNKRDLNQPNLSKIHPLKE
nr:nudix hydrolase 10-like [Ipomoea batatas]